VAAFCPHSKRPARLPCAGRAARNPDGDITTTTFDRARALRRTGAWQSVFFGRTLLLSLVVVMPHLRSCYSRDPSVAPHLGILPTIMVAKKSLVITVTGVGIATRNSDFCQPLANWNFSVNLVHYLAACSGRVLSAAYFASTFAIGAESVPAQWRSLKSGLITEAVWSSAPYRSSRLSSVH
jgi:hypothetical protein